jgi:hypothetical protein
MQLSFRYFDVTRAYINTSRKFTLIIQMEMKMLMLLLLYSTLKSLIKCLHVRPM